jgi:hypothetical protein
LREEKRKSKLKKKEKGKENGEKKREWRDIDLKFTSLSLPFFPFFPFFPLSFFFNPHFGACSSPVPFSLPFKEG